MIESKFNLQFSGGNMIPKGIVLHNTNNNYGAIENYELMIKSDKEYSAHFFIDAIEVIQALPLDVQAFHTGKAYDEGNKSTIAIEMCSKGNESEFEETIKNTVLIIQMIREKLGTLPIYYHNDFDNQAYCPHRLLDQYKSKENFLRRWNIGN